MKSHPSTLCKPANEERVVLKLSKKYLSRTMGILAHVSREVLALSLPRSPVPDGIRPW
jgi:hypothetical protein